MTDTTRIIGDITRVGVGDLTRVGVDKLITVKEAAQRLGCSVESIWKFLRLGKLQRVKIGRMTRIREQDLEACIRVGVQL